MSKRQEKLLIRKMAKIMIEEDVDFEGKRETSVEEWILTVESSGISADFSDENFLTWFVGKCSREFDFSEKVRSVAKRFFELKILDPSKNELHSEILSTIVWNDVVGDRREWYKLVQDYCIRNFRNTEVGKLAVKFAKSFGVTTCTWKEVYGEDFVDPVIIGERKKENRGTLSHV